MTSPSGRVLSHQSGSDLDLLFAAREDYQESLAAQRESSSSSGSPTIFHLELDDVDPPSGFGRAPDIRSDTPSGVNTSYVRSSATRISDENSNTLPHRNPPNMSSITGFREFDNSSEEVVNSAEFNFYGDRLVTGSSDHRLRVYAKVGDTDELKETDAWRGHDAEVTGVKWCNPTMGEVFGSVGEDLKLKIWAKDATQAAHSGRTFRCIYSQSSPRHVAYVALDFKDILSETYLALITRDGLLSLSEPINQGSLRDWKELDQIFPHGSAIYRGDESSFALSFQQSPTPTADALASGISMKVLSLAVAAMNVVKVYRIQKNELGVYHFQAPVAVLTGAQGLVRSVDWNRVAYQKNDLIATAADDHVRIYELSVPLDPSIGNRYAIPEATPAPPARAAAAAAQASSSRSGPSGIGASIAGASGAASGVLRNNEADVGVVRHEWKVVAELPEPRVSQVMWMGFTGKLVSVGDDGKAKVWDKTVDGEWEAFAEVDAQDSGEEDAGEEEEEEEEEEGKDQEGPAMANLSLQ